MNYVTVAPLKGYYFSYTLKNQGGCSLEIDEVRNIFSTNLDVGDSVLQDLESSYLIKSEEESELLRNKIINKFREIADDKKVSKESYSLLVTLIEISKDNFSSDKITKKEFANWCKSKPIDIATLPIKITTK